jgi:Protein kinase domain
MSVIAPCRQCGLFHPDAAPCRALTPPTSYGQEVLPLGARVAQRYEIVAIIHHGPMSTVYRAVDTLRGTQQVILKELAYGSLPEGERQEALQWFLREAHLLSTLKHPALPALYGSFADAGQNYLAMDLVPGHTLETLRDRSGAVREEQALSWGLELCDVLHYLHSQPEPVIYRDLKPANILLDPRTDSVCLIDFGVSARVTPGVPGTAIGTPGYAAPEQYQGLADARSDVYALGATLHRMLTGYDAEHEPPFRHPPVRSLNPAISEGTAAVVDRALALDPQARYANMQEMFKALRVATRSMPEMAVTLVRPFYRSTSLLPFVTLLFGAFLELEIVGEGTPSFGALVIVLLVPAILYIFPTYTLWRRIRGLQGNRAFRAADTARTLLVLRISSYIVAWFSQYAFANDTWALILFLIPFLLWCVGVRRALRRNKNGSLLSTRSAALLKSGLRAYGPTL